MLQFPLSYILSKHTMLAQNGIWWAFPVTNIIAVVISVAYFHRGNWKERRMTEEIRITEQITEESIIEEGIM